MVDGVKVLEPFEVGFYLSIWGFGFWILEGGGSQLGSGRWCMWYVSV